MSATALNAPPVTGSGLTTGIVVFTARGSSWVEVVDANGVVQVRKTMTNGEVVGVSGAMPLMVVVGRANTTEVQVRGIPFDLLRIAKDNVARFEVK
jgi:cytoskeleton protein RodZ